MKNYLDFSEPMPKSEKFNRKIEFMEEKEKYETTSNHVKLPYASEVIARTKREPRQKTVSPLLRSFINGSIHDENKKQMPSHRVMSENATNARNEVLSRVGIKR